MTHQADVTRVAAAIEKAGTDWIAAQRRVYPGVDPGWADVPESIFAEAAIAAVNAAYGLIPKINTPSPKPADEGWNLDQAALRIARVYYWRVQGRVLKEDEWATFHKDAKETWLLAASAGLEGAQTNVRK